MAEAEAKSVLGTISRGHLECPICCCRFTDPKMLDCLHSFCLNCLKEFTRRQLPKAHEITCPVCRRITAVPDTGLQGLPNCFFLSALVDEFNKQERLLGDVPVNAPTCEECEEGLEAVSRCLDCCKFICTKCLKAHKRMKSMRLHRIIGKEEHKFAEALIGPRKKDNLKCNKHHNQDICLYCETCKTLACAACAALDHRGAEHEYREVADAIRSYRQNVDEILQRFEQSREEFKVADDSLSHARNRLRIKVARACKDVTTKEEEEISKIRNKSRLLRDKVTQIGEARDRKFEEVQKSNRDKMERAEQIVATVNDLMQQADDFELLDLKPKVMHNLQFQDELEFEQAQHDLSFIGVKCQDVVADTDIGEVLQEENWQLKVEFGETGPEDGKLEGAVGVACLTNGDIAVTDLEKQQLMVFTSTGEYKETVGGEQLIEPLSVAVTVGGLLLVTDNNYVKVLDSSLSVIRQFATDDADDETDLSGIAVDKENRTAVADCAREMIYLHHLDGSLIRTIPNDMVGGGLAIGIRERLIFTNNDESKLICITYTGDEVFNVDTLLDGEPVRPFGVCCDDAGDIYVNVGIREGESREDSEGSEGSESHDGSEDDERFGSCEVHHYSPEGVFIGRVACGLNGNLSLTFTQSGDLVVADGVSVKIFQRV